MHMESTLQSPRVPCYEVSWDYTERYVVLQSSAGTGMMGSDGLILFATCCLAHGTTREILKLEESFICAEPTALLSGRLLNPTMHVHGCWNICDRLS